MKKILKALFWLVLIVALVGVWVLGYFGFIPGISALFGSDQPKDLGVVVTEADLVSAQEKLGQSFVETSGDPNEQLNASPSHPVSAVLTNTEWAAHMERVHPVDDLQIRISGNTVEASGRIVRDRIPGMIRTLGYGDISDTEILDTIDRYLPNDPVFYLSGTGSVQNDDVTVALTEVELGRFSLPQEDVSEGLAAYFEAMIEAAPGFSVSSVTLSDAGLSFSGIATNEVPQY